MSVRGAIDASSAVSGGGITYLREVLPRLSEQRDIEVVALLLRDGSRERLGLPTNLDLVCTEGRGRFAAASVRWQQTVRKVAVDVVFTPTEVSFSSYGFIVVLVLRNAMLAAD